MATTTAPTRPRISPLVDDAGTIVLVAAALIWLSLEDGGYTGVPRHAAGLIAWLVVLAVFLVRGPRALPRGPVLIVGGTIAALAALSGLSMLWSEAPGRSFVELTRALTYLGVFLAVAGLAAGSARRRGALLEGLTLGMVAVLAFAVLSRLEPGWFPAQIYQTLPAEFRPRLAYPLGYWNAVGSFAAITVPLLVHAASRVDRPRAYRALATGLLPLNGLAIYLTFSRGAIFATGVACALLLLLSPRRLSALGSIAIGAIGAAALVLLVRTYPELNDGLIDTAAARSQGDRVLVALIVVAALAAAARIAGERSSLPGRLVAALRPHARKLAIAGGVVVLIGAVAAAPKLADRWDQFREPVVVQGTGQAAPDQGVAGRLGSGGGNGRYQFWSESVDAWQASPVAGRGAGTWEFWWRRNASIDSPTRDSHSLFFDALAELGTLGVLALLALIGSVLWVCLAAARRAPPAARPALAAILAGAVAWSIGAMIDWSWEVTALTAPFFVLAALGASARRSQVEADSEHAEAAEPPARGRRRSPALAAAALAAWAIVLLQGVGLVGDWSLQRSRDAVAERDWQTALDHAERANSVQPWSAEPLMQIALVRARITPDMRAVRPAREAVDKEDTNWRAWLTLTRVEARSGQLGAASEHRGVVEKLAKGSPLVPSYEQLHALSVGRDKSLDPDGP